MVSYTNLTTTWFSIIYIHNSMITINCRILLQMTKCLAVQFFGTRLSSTK